jgi:hypothetical protein
MISTLLNTPLKVGLIAIIILLALTGGRWWGGGRDLTRFMVCGDSLTNPDKTPVPLQVITNCPGYDGQFFARLAFAPFTREKTACGITLDSPSYRQQRIIYPFLAWLLAAGKPELIPWTLVAVNFLALIGIAVVAAMTAARFHLNPGYGLLPMLSCGLILSFGRNLAEPLTTFFVISALFFMLKNEMILCAAAASLAVLTRESSLITFAAAGLTMFVYTLKDKQRPRNFSCFWLLLPLIVYGLWQVYLKMIWGCAPVASGPTMSPYPLKDFILRLWHYPYRQKPLECLIMIMYLLWYFRLAFEVVNIFRTKPKRAAVTAPACYLDVLRTAWLFWAAFILFLPTCMWVDDWGFTRIMAEWGLLGWMNLFARGQKPGGGLVIFTLILAAGSILRLWLRP